MSVKGKLSNEHWYCIRSKVKREQIAAAVLRDKLDLEVFCPRLRSKRKTDRGVVWVEEALFPGYFFARFDFRKNYRAVLYAQGVTGMVHFGDKYATVPEKIIDDLKVGFEDEEVYTVEDKLEEGVEVEVASGPFKGLLGVVRKSLPAKERIRILLDMLGREVEAELDMEQIVPKKQD